MRTNKIKARMNAGEKAVGFQTGFCSPDLVELMGMAGADYVFIDAEHGSFSPGEIETMCRTADMVGVTPIARVPNIDPSVIWSVISRGIMGIIAPHIQTVAQAQQLVSACLWSPRGIRSAGNSRGNLFGTHELTRENMQQENEQMLIVAMIEEEVGFKNLPEILEVEGIDVIKWGAHDILLDMEFDGEKTADAIARGTELVHATGKYVEPDVMLEDQVVRLFLEGAKAHVAQGRAK